MTVASSVNAVPGSYPVIVLGDIPGGNGDSSLTLFGHSIAPNLQAVAQPLFCWTTLINSKLANAASGGTTIHRPPPCLRGGVFQ